MKFRNSVFSAVILFASGQYLAAQQTRYSISANVVTPRIVVGDRGSLEIKAIGGEPETVPRSIEVPGLNIYYTGQQFHQESSNINGRLVTKLNYLYYYSVEGSTPGEYTIPSISAKIRGQEVKTLPVKVRIQKSNASSVNPTGNKFARLTIPQSKLYVNQIFPVDSAIYVAGHNAIQGVSGADLKHESFVIKRFQQVAIESSEIQGKIYSVAKLPTTVFALKAGKHQLGPASFNVKLYETSSRFSVPSFFTQLRTHVLRSDVAAVEILPLPGGAPRSFTGGVGAFEMESTARPLQLKVGDPVTIDFTITGAGNLETMSAPLIPNLDPDVWKSYDAKKNLVEESDGINPGRAQFSQVLIPLVEVDEIPPYEISFFDPDHGQYVTRRTLATKISVSPDNSSPASNPLSSNPGTGTGQAFPAPSTSVPIPQFTDVLHIRKSIPKWKTYTATSGSGILLAFTNGILGLGFVALLALGSYRKLKSIRAARDANPKPLVFKEVSQKIRPGTDREEFYHSTYEAFSLWESENPEAPEDILRLIGDLKGKCETALYSKDGEKDSQPISAKEASEFLKVLRKLPS